MKGVTLPISKNDTPIEPKTKKARLVINIMKGCASVGSPIPPGIELVIKDYDGLEESETTKRDEYGQYEETCWTAEDNEVLRRCRGS